MEWVHQLENRTTECVKGNNTTKSYEFPAMVKKQYSREWTYVDNNLFQFTDLTKNFKMLVVTGPGAF